MAQKVSIISGAKARRFLQRPPSKAPKFPTSTTSTKIWELWKDLCSFTTSGGSDPNVALLREKVWVDFNIVFWLMNLQNNTPNQRHQFSEAMRSFTTSFVNAWGEVNATHSIVSSQATVSLILVLYVSSSLFGTSCSISYLLTVLGL